MIYFIHYKLDKGEISPKCNMNDCIYLNSEQKWDYLKINQHPPLFEFFEHFSIPFIDMKNFQINLNDFEHSSYKTFISKVKFFLERSIFNSNYLQNDSDNIYTTIISRSINCIPSDIGIPPGKGFTYFIDMTIILGNQPMIYPKNQDKWIPKCWDSTFIKNRHDFYVVDKIMEN